MTEPRHHQYMCNTNKQETKRKLIHRFLGLRPYTCLHLAMLWIREYKGLHIKLPMTKEELEDKEFVQTEFTRYAKIIDKPEDGAVVFLYDPEGKTKPHIGITLKVDSQWKILHCSDIDAANTFNARLSKLSTIKKSFPKHLYLQFDKDNEGVDVDLSEAGFVGQLALHFFSAAIGGGSAIGGTLGATGNLWQTIYATILVAGNNIPLILTSILISNIFGGQGGFQSLFGSEETPEGEETRRVPVSPTYSLVATRNPRRPNVPMSVIAGQHRIVHSLGNNVWQRFTQDDDVDVYAILHSGVNAGLEYEDFSTALDQTAISSFPRSRLNALSGPAITTVTPLVGGRVRIIYDPQGITTIPSNNVIQLVQDTADVEGFLVSSPVVGVKIPANFAVVPAGIGTQRTSLIAALRAQPGATNITAILPGTTDTIGGARFSQAVEFETTVDRSLGLDYIGLYVYRLAGANENDVATIELTIRSNFGVGSNFQENVIQTEGQPTDDIDTIGEWFYRTLTSDTGFQWIEMDFVAQLQRTRVSSGGTQQRLMTSVDWGIELAIGGTLEPDSSTGELILSGGSGWQAVSWDEDRLEDANTVLHEAPSTYRTEARNVSPGQYRTLISNTFNPTQQQAREIHIRFRRVSDFPDDINTIANLNFAIFRGVRNIPLSTDFTFQNRLGVVLRGSEISGLQRAKISTICRGLCPVKQANGQWSTDLRFTSNPAAWFRHFLLGHTMNGRLIYGLGATLAEIDEESIDEWYDYCEAEGLEFNGVIESAVTNFNVLQRLLITGHGVLTQSNGRWGVWIDRATPRQTAQALFTEDDIISGSLKINFAENTAVDGLAYEFYDEDNYYEFRNESIPFPSGRYRDRSVIIPAEPLSPRREVLYGVSNAAKALREATYRAQKEVARQERVLISVSAMNFHVAPGSIISVQHRRFGPDPETFLVRSVKYRGLQMELGMVRPSLPHPDDVPSGYRGPIYPALLLEDPV